MLGIGVGTYLVLILKNVNKILNQARTITEANEKSIDTTIKQLPEISENINGITKEAKVVLNQLTPEINGLVKNANSISGNISSITENIDSTTNKVSGTIDTVSESISETALAFEYNVKNVSDYIQMFVEIIDIIKYTLKKK
jgi:ABC-type transporter Mla subunit MlaD